MIQPTRISDIKRTWHLVDAKGQTLGRFATGVATKLVGKNKPYFVRNLDCGDYVIVINAGEIKVTGNKNNTKVYTRFSGYPAGLRSTTLGKMREEHPAKVVELAIKGMLPNNKLKDIWVTRLFVYTDATHPYTDKFKSN